MTRKKENYFEAHVTIEPVFEEDFEALDKICNWHNFRRAELLMQKRKNDTPERSRYDTFCTARAYSEKQLRYSVKEFVKELQVSGFTVWRYKVEETVFDSRYVDVLDLLDRSKLPDKELNPRDPCNTQELAEAI